MNRHNTRIARAMRSTTTPKMSKHTPTVFAPELLAELDKAASRFDRILSMMSELATMTATQRMSYDDYVRKCRDEARAVVAKAKSVTSSDADCHAFLHGESKGNYSGD